MNRQKILLLWRLQSSPRYTDERIALFEINYFIKECSSGVPIFSRSEKFPPHGQRRVTRRKVYLALYIYIYICVCVCVCDTSSTSRGGCTTERWATSTTKFFTHTHTHTHTHIYTYIYVYIFMCAFQRATLSTSQEESPTERRATRSP